MTGTLPTVLVLGQDGQPARINQQDFDPAVHLGWDEASKQAETLAGQPLAELRAMARGLGLAGIRGLSRETLSLRILSARGKTA